MKVQADLSPRSRARIETESLEGDGTHVLTIDNVEFSGSLEDVEDVMDELQHCLMLLKSGRRQSETLPMQHSEAASRLRHPTNAA